MPIGRIKAGFFRLRIRFLLPLHIYELWNIDACFSKMFEEKKNILQKKSAPQQHDTRIKINEKIIGTTFSKLIYNEIALIYL